MKSLKYSLLVLAVMVSVIISSQQSPFEQYVRENQQAFQDFQDAEAGYKEEVTQQYETYVREQQQAFEEFREEVERKWDVFRYSSKKEYVDYNEDLNSRGSVDYEDGTVGVEVLENPEDPTAAQNARERIEQKIIDLVQTRDTEGNSILQDQLETADGQTVNRDNVQQFAQQVTKEKPVQSSTYTDQEGNQRTKYTVTIPMVPDHLAKRASRYKTEVIRQSNRFRVDPPLAFAVIQTESYFNPRARSHIPAFGLMQLVPQSGARDAYLFVYNRDTLLTGEYLFVPRNNIELGCAYFSKLRNVYFQDIEDDSSAYYCAIAAYNTGPGNVARALTGRKQLRPMISAVNAHNRTWVYRKLLRDLPYDETKDYLRKVRNRAGTYQSWR